MENLTLNVIYDSRRFERWHPLINELATQGIFDYKIWSPVEAKTVVESINLTHKQIVQNAKERKLPMVAIAEDDVMFPAKDGWKYFLRNIPKEFDIYSAATYILDINNKNHLCGFHCYIVHEKFYDIFLSVPDEAHIDTAIDKMGGDFVVCKPFAALQRPGYSSTNKAVVNYNNMLKEEHIYTG